MLDYIDYKTDKEKQDWERLDPRVKGLLLALALWQYLKWGIRLTITCITRTPDENLAVGGMIHSAHVLIPNQIWARAVDIRNSDLTPEQQRERREFVLVHWNWKTMPPMFHMIDHDAGGGQHTHLNLNYQYLI